MTDDNDKINRLQVKLDSLIKRQGLFLTEINTLKEEIIQLKIYGEKKQFIEKDLKENKPITTANIEIPKTKVQFSTKENVPQVPASTGNVYPQSAAVHWHSSVALRQAWPALFPIYPAAGRCGYVANAMAGSALFRAVKKAGLTPPPAQYAKRFW